MQENNFTTLALLAAHTGTSWDGFINTLADKVVARITPIIGEKPLERTNYIRGIRAVAKELGCSTSTIQQWINSGKIKYHKIGNRYLFTPKDIDEALKREED